MPSSPGPTDYKRTLQRFFYRGISLMPQDALPEGKLTWIRNMRSYEEGTLEVRYGIADLLDTPVADAIHSIIRLDDTTPFGGATPSQRFLGAGSDLHAMTVGSAATSLVDTGYSGDPLTAVVTTPYRSPRPFVYIGDADRQRKVNSDLIDYSIGLPTPAVAPTAVLNEPQLTVIDEIDGGNWQGYGPNVLPAGPLVPLDRINTTLTYIFYDDGSTNTGMASVGVADFANFTPGCRVEIGGAETVVVQSIHPPVAPTTIAAILYDSGNTGWASIQLTGGLSVGQIEAALPNEYDGRHHLGGDNVPRVTVTRTVDFPVDSLIVINGVETVPIRSISIGIDDVVSIRVTTTGTYAAGATITGLPSFRAWFNTTRSLGDAVIEQAIEVTLTPTTTGDPDVGGFQAAVTASPRDLGRVGTRAMTPDDIIRFGIKVSLLGYVEFVRLMIDVSSGTPYTTDYYVYEWRAADLLDAIQATSEATTSSFVDGQAVAVERGQTQSIYSDQYAQGQITTNDPVVGTTPGGGQIRRGISGPMRAPLTDQQRTDIRRNGGLWRQITRRNSAAKAAPVVAGGTISRQLALGNDVWMTLECRVGDLTRIGTRTDLNLTTVTAACVYVQVLGTTTPITLQLTAGYLYGGYGPDVGLTLSPYVYRYSYRSTLTGERSNTSPAMRAGMRPQRGRVTLGMNTCEEPQCDAIDIWRFGGALARWTYVGTTLNDPAASPATAFFDDEMADSQIDGGPIPRVDLFQPWPTTDLPRSGTCRVAGTSIEWLSGDLFNPSWSADTLIIVNGRATSLYAPPASTTRLEVVDNVGSGDVDFSIPSPTLLAQNLPVIWGGTIANSLFTFACGDPNDPGALHWSNTNDPDSSGDVNILHVSTPAEPLQNGYLEDGNAYVFSTDRQYRIVPDPGGVSQFRAVETNCTQGLWARWAMAVDPDGGCYFLNKSGIYRTVGGQDAQTITAPDLQPLFPHDGSPSEFIRNFEPIDFDQLDRLRLSFVDGILYFDYVDTAGNGRTLLFEPKYNRWSHDVYLEDTTQSPPAAVGVRVRLSEPGPQVHNHLLAINNQLYLYTIDKITDVLDSINYAIWTPWAHGDDPRAWKQWGDAILDFNPGGAQDGVRVTPIIDNGNVALQEQILGQSGTLRDTYLVEIGATAADFGDGIYSRNCGLWIEGNCQACDIQRPIFYLWEPSYLWKGTSVAFRTTDWEDLGYKGAKFVQGVVIRANTFGLQKTVAVQFDGPNGAPQTAMTLSLVHNGEQSIAYPISDEGWQPFLAELVRLQGADTAEWILLDWRFVWEPAPEAATQWETQDTTFDLPGFLSVRDGVMAYSADAPIELVVWHDQTPITYILPASTDGDYQRVYVPFGPYKGKSVKFQWFSDLAFRLYKRDCSVRIQGWGIPGGYQIMSPFGGPHRVDGAGI